MSSDSFEFVNSRIKPLSQKANDDGLDSLSSVQQTALLVWWAVGIIENGGFEYFFEGSTNIDLVADAFRSVGLPIAADACLEAKTFFPQEVLSQGHEACDKWLREQPKQQVDVFFNPLNKEIWKLIWDDVLDPLVEKFIRENINHFSMVDKAP